MVRREPQLVVFTVFTQMSVGLVVSWGLSAYAVSTPDIFLAPGFLRLVLSVALLVLVLGVVSAILHLGSPHRAPLALANIQRSWLSREALVGSIFGSFAIILLLSSWTGAYPGLTWFLMVAVSLAGVGLVCIIARLYMLRTIPAWNHPGTPATFLITSLILGIAALQAIYAWFYSHGRMPMVWVRPLDWVLVGLIGLQGVTKLSSMAFLSSQGATAIQSLQVVWSELRPFWLARWVLALGGVGLLLVRTSAGNIFGIGSFGASLLVLSLLSGSELIGRWIFYGSYQRKGI